MRHTRPKRKSQFESVMKAQPELLWSTVYEILKDNYSTDENLNADMLELAMALRNEHYIRKDLIKKQEKNTKKLIDTLQKEHIKRLNKEAHIVRDLRKRPEKARNILCLGSLKNRKKIRYV